MLIGPESNLFFKMFRHYISIWHTDIQLDEPRGQFSMGASKHQHCALYFIEQYDCQIQKNEIRLLKVKDHRSTKLNNEK